MSEISVSTIKKQGGQPCSPTNGCDSTNVNSKQECNEDDSDDSETEGQDQFKIGILSCNFIFHIMTVYSSLYNKRAACSY